MNIHRKMLLAKFIAILIYPPGALAGDLYVVVNNGVSLSPSDIRDVFLGEKQLAGATKLVPIDNAATQKDFLEKVIKVDATKYSNIWAKKGFRDGLNPPAVKSGDAEVVAIVKATPGAIGYVTAVPVGVKVLQKY
ncbi:hypothetical protein AAKU55_004275 [Oxalobacteraceae bacterium GrIS 1.11]